MAQKRADVMPTGAKGMLLHVRTLSHRTVNSGMRMFVSSMVSSWYVERGREWPSPSPVYMDVCYHRGNGGLPT